MTHALRPIFAATVLAFGLAAASGSHAHVLREVFASIYLVLAYLLAEVKTDWE